MTQNALDPDDPSHGVVVLPLKDGRYFSVVAFVYGKEERDWLMSVWRDADGPWQVRYRFRYYTWGLILGSRQKEVLPDGSRFESV